VTKSRPLNPLGMRRRPMGTMQRNRRGKRI
jgi:hypothetical protein